MQTTSRTAALDYLLAIGNLLALYDHKMEQASNLLEEKLAVPTLEATDEEKDQLNDSINKELVTIQVELRNFYNLRKDLQRNFFARYNIDKDYRCQFKHLAIALTATEECYNADPTAQNRTLLMELRRVIYWFLGTVMWVWPANCWRCLADMLEDGSEEENNLPM